MGDAMVSPLHGNFIVNRGSALATDVLALIDQVREEVVQQTGIQLELEVKRWLG
jgi:UDP-N-acetylmuramate dehydrogenase